MDLFEPIFNVGYPSRWKPSYTISICKDDMKNSENLIDYDTFKRPNRAIIVRSKAGRLQPAACQRQGYKEKT